MPSFRVKPDKLVLYIPQSFEGYIQRAKERGKELEITIQEVADPRTVEQNALFHCLIRRLAQQSGASEQWMKDYIKNEAVRFGYPYWVENGKVVMNEGKAVAKPTHQATVKELMILIEVCYTVAFNNGLDIGEEENGRLK